MVAAWNSESGDNIGGALRSTDDGASWFDSSSGLPAFFRGPRLCASPSDPQTLGDIRRGLASSPAVSSAPLTAVRPGLLRAGQETKLSETLRVIQSTIRCSLLLN